ncbi:unnamed protein product [Heligmosomoides polygyrus]|uniref:DUF547 domain-containing protein n=1 Tax=Heligmosomoides polygyrus TaxID=6339 RepID=A0A183GHX4_HELPZ|nr:unnamed protein product [Heligmosomoides polygyrus]
MEYIIHTAEMRSASLLGTNATTQIPRTAVGMGPFLGDNRHSSSHRSINKVGKLIYLLEELYGSAKDVVNDLQVTADSYDVTIQLIRRKYANQEAVLGQFFFFSFFSVYPHSCGDAVKDLNNWNDKGYTVDAGQGVEEMLNKLNVADMKIGLEMNMSKTQFMVNQWCDTGLVRFNGVALQQIDFYVYLGREPNTGNDLAPEITRRRRAAGQPSV